ncbi:MAG TPA: matrixin family metalloprotease, partial [Burkholderiales bacterium]|nr:matrixin family metalloprotease [Burkholderiales bacterium]
GHGWFVDLTPARNEEFRMHADGGILTATPRSEAFGHMDLLTAVMHEIGHVLGFTHDDAAQYAVMNEALEAGTRYSLDAPRFEFDLPSAANAGGAISWDDWGSDWTPSHKPRGGHAERHLPGFLRFF